MKNAPKKIYLQMGFQDLPENDFDDLAKDEITWTDERVYPDDLEYILKSDVTLSRRDEIASSIYPSVRAGVFNMDEWGGEKGTLNEASAIETVKAVDDLIAELDKEANNG